VQADGACQQLFFAGGDAALQFAAGPVAAQWLEARVMRGAQLQTICTLFERKTKTPDSSVRGPVCSGC